MAREPFGAADNPLPFADALAALSPCPVLGPLVARCPPPGYAQADDAFAALCGSIVHQQLSGRAAATIYRRFAALVDEPTPESVLTQDETSLRAVGLSRQKAASLRDLALKWRDGTLEPERFGTMSDDEVKAHLVQVRGIGPWSADMFLMFALVRPDVLPVGDLGIRSAMMRSFALDALPSPAQMTDLASPWRPHRTVASWYLWRSLEL